jgi:hypothetical protein
LVLGSINETLLSVLHKSAHNYPQGSHSGTCNHHDHTHKHTFSHRQERVGASAWFLITHSLTCPLDGLRQDLCGKNVHQLTQGVDVVNGEYQGPEQVGQEATQ